MKKSKLKKQGFFTKAFKAFTKDCKGFGVKTIQELDKMFKNGMEIT